MPMVQQRPGIRRTAREPEGGRPLNTETGKPEAPSEYDIHWKTGDAEHLIGQTRRVDEGKNGSWRPLPVAVPDGASWPDPCKTHTLAIEELCKAWEATHPNGVTEPPAPPEPPADGAQEPAQAEPQPRRKAAKRKQAGADLVSDLRESLEGGTQEPIPGTDPVTDPAELGITVTVNGEPVQGSVEEFAPGVTPPGPLPPLSPDTDGQLQTWTPQAEPDLSSLLGATELEHVPAEHVVVRDDASGAVTVVSDADLAAFLDEPPAVVPPLPPPAQAIPATPSMLPPPVHPPVPPGEFAWDDIAVPPVPSAPAPLADAADWLTAPPAAPGVTAPADPETDLFPYA